MSSSGGSSVSCISHRRFYAVTGGERVVQLVVRDGKGSTPPNFRIASP